MVSRTPRHQSQPRPSKSQIPSRKGSSFDVNHTNNINSHGGQPSYLGGISGGGGGHASYQYDQRRAKSSMRYQSNGRDSSRAKTRSESGASSSGGLEQSMSSSNLMLGGPSEKQHRLSYASPSGGGGGGGNSGNSASRPRAISAGRLRGGPSQPPSSFPTRTSYNDEVQDDPSAVARQILDLREQRESSLKRSKSIGGGGGSLRPNTPHNKKASNNFENDGGSGGSSPRGLVLKAVGSGLSQEEVQAEERLQSAETKINGLLQELEELKFFQEIEDGHPAPPTTPRTPRMTPRNVSNGNAGVAPGPPTTIRALSPARGGRLPPPPPANPLTKNNVNGISTSSHNNIGGGGLETYKPLSPRSISKLDRNSLELECQTLVRKLQIYEQEKASHAATIEMYELSLKENDADKVKVQRLEGELQKVSGELKKQLQNIQKGKESLVRDYEEKLQSNLKKLHRTQEKADSYRSDVETVKANAERFRQELERHRAQAMQEKSRADEMAVNAETVQMQLEEARNLNATLVKKVEKKRYEVTNLKEDLTNTNKLMEESARDREEEYQSRIHCLEQQLSMSKDRYARLEKQSAEQNTELVEKEKELNQASDRELEQENKIQSLYSQIENLERAVDARYEEGKKAAKKAETRKVQELVAERSNSAHEYERRIKAMQEQLRHQTDRHHAEIKETRDRNEKNLQSMKEELREDIRRTEGDKVHILESEMARLKRNFEEEKMNYNAKLQEAQNKARSVGLEFERQDKLRQEELDQLHERLNAYFTDLSDRDAKILELSQQLDDRHRTIQELGDLRKDDSMELRKREKLLEEERKKLSETEAALTGEIATMKATYIDLESSLRSEITNLREQAEDSERKLAKSMKLLEEFEDNRKKLDEVQHALKLARGEILAERTRYENTESELRVELAKIQGRLRAGESALESKTARVEELENELVLASSASLRVGEERQSQIAELRQKLKEMTSRADEERAAAESKEAEVDQLKAECDKFRDRLAVLTKLEDEAQDLKTKLEQAQGEKKAKEYELMDSKMTRETSRSRVLEAEEKLANIRADFESRMDKKERLIIDLEADKSRIMSELASLRKDYDDLSGLLEENMHSSINQNEVDRKLRTKELEMRQTVDSHKRQLSDLKMKIKDEVTSKEALRMNTVALQKSLDKVEDEKAALSVSLRDVERKYKEAQSELIVYKEQQQISRGGMEADLDRKDIFMREAVQRYMTTIADLESQLEESAHSKKELEDRLTSARSELEDKQNYTEEIVQRHTKTTVKLESELEKLKSDLDRTTKELKRKSLELDKTVAKSNDEHYQSTRDDLRQKERQISDMSEQISVLRSDLDVKSRECTNLKVSSQRCEAELKQRKEQLNDIVGRYSDQIADLESKLDEHSISTHGRVESVQAEATQKDKKIKELLKSLADLETKLEVANRNREDAKQKTELLTRDLDDKETELRNLEVEKIELETKLHTQSRSKDELRGKISELSSRLERKEREVREVSDRYKMYVMELESKLDQDMDAKYSLQSEIDKLRTNLNSAAEASSEASDLRQKVLTLEKSVESYRSKARDLESRSNEASGGLLEKLDAVMKSKMEVEEALKKANSEKAEVIAALEGVINEVQNREDEIENLSDALQRREEELQHAKIIATKALQSAKDIQKRYKDQDRHSDLMERMDEVSDNVDRLTTKNEELQRKISTLERELRDKNLECKRLKDQLRQIDGKPYVKDDISAVSTQSSYSAQSYPNPALAGSLTGGSAGLRVVTDPRLEPPASFDSASHSPTPKEYDRGISPGGVGPYISNDDFPSVEKQYSRDFDAGGGDGAVASSSDIGARWIHDFDSVTNSFESLSTNGDQGPNGNALTSKSRKSIERDALRKYVQQRYTHRSNEKPSYS